MDIQRTNAATKIQSLTRGHLARKAIKQPNNAATKIQSVYRGHKVRKDLAQNQDDILRATLDTWVNEAPNERHVRQQVKDQIQIVNGQLVVEGDLDLRHTNISSLPQGLDVNGVLNLTNCSNLRILPQDLHVGGSLILTDCSNLRILRQHLHVGGDLYLDDCTSLTSLPVDLHVGGSLILTDCSNLRILFQDLHVGGDLYLDDCTSLTSLPQDLHVGGSLILTNCSNLRILPQDLHVGGNLCLGYCISLTALPQGLHVGGYLTLSYCTRLETLPQGLHVGASLYLLSCRSLRELPQGLTLGGNLNLGCCTSLTELPQGLHVGGDLELYDCTSLTTLPENLHVGGDLYLLDWTSLIELPQGLHVGGSLDLRNCTRLTSLPDWVFNVSDLISVPDHLQQINTYKIFQILKHFDTHNTIDGINSQELIDLYNQNQERINLLKYNRHCFRIAYALCTNGPLTPQQQTFKDNANEQTKNQIRDHLVHTITSFRPDIFKKLPGINKYSSLSIVKDSDGNVSGIGILPFVANSGLLSASETQGLRIICKSFKKRDILDQQTAYQNNKHLWPSLHTIEQILQDWFSNLQT